MAEDRKAYTVMIGGLPHEMMLTDEDAERYGDRATLSAEKKAAPAPKNKARTAPTKAK